MVPRLPCVAGKMPFFRRDRAAALFAQPLTRIAAPTVNDIDLSGEEVRITLGPPGPIPVPEPFGQILRDHAADRGSHNIEANRTSPRLFPGRQPGRWAHPVYFRPGAGGVRGTGVPVGGAYAARVAAKGMVIIAAFALPDMVLFSTVAVHLIFNLKGEVRQAV